MKNKLVLIDGNAIIHRSYHAYPKTLTTSSGELTNAVYGFASTILNVVNSFEPTHVTVAFDVKGPTFRHEKYIGYKASRPPMDDELVGQLSRVREFVDVLGVPRFGIEGYEADDVIGTIAMQAKNNGGFEVVVVTGDKDILQLLEPDVDVFFPARGRSIVAKTYNVKIFEDEWKFEPLKLIDFKALAGDNSDEIPGVRGVGPKTATDLIVRFGGLDGIYENLGEIRESVRKKLIVDKESAYMSKELATIVKDVPIEWDADKSKLVEYDKTEAEEFLLNMEFRSLIRRLPGSDWTPPDQGNIGSEPKEKKVKVEDVIPEGQGSLF